MITRLSLLAVLGTALPVSPAAAAEATGATPGLRDLNRSDFPFTQVKDRAAWELRREQIRERVLLAAGLLPMPEKTPLNAVVHGRVERDDYTVDKVIFESLPGNFVTGNLYLPKRHGDRIPGILCPYGHWPNGRFMDAKDTVKKQLESGAERFESGARAPLQARCVQLARMGCAVFHYDMLGYADSVQFLDNKGAPGHRHGPRDHGFLSAAAELELCGAFQLQTWNSVRALDFIASLPMVDKSRLGCTGASGGGTQTLVLTAIDDRVKAAFPCVMASTAMQGGCTCENASYLRIGQGNIDIAAMAAPRPLGLTAADDWTKELEHKGFPDLKNLYTMLGVPDLVEAHYNIGFPHNYNAVSRAQMERFFNRHFALGLTDEALAERDFTRSTQAELSVWDARHPAPGGNQVGTPHEVAVIDWFKRQDTGKPGILRRAWEILLGGRLPQSGASGFAGTSEQRGDHLIVRGVTQCGGAATNATFIYPQRWNHTTVLWLSLAGEASVIGSSGDLTSSAGKLLAAGYAIACPTLSLPGAPKNPSVNATRPQDDAVFAGYTYGYNPPLLARRIQDALAMIAAIRDSKTQRAEHIIVAGTEGAGVIAVAAAAMSGTAVAQIIDDTGSFRFAALSDAWDVNFLPGAVKYGDLPALLGMCSAKTRVAAQPGADAVAADIVAADAAPTVTLKPVANGLRVEIDGQLFTEYITKDTPRPILYPIIGAGGASVVRNFPMRTDVPGEAKDHPHHRSLWFAHGSVNGVDFWSEAKGFGKQEHVGFGGQHAAGSTADFTADTKWVTATGTCVMTDSRKITVTALATGERYLDFDITLKASEGTPVVLGDTKEGTMALRLCPSLSLTGAGAQGHAFNSGGDRGAAIWGKRADWVCYYGPDPQGTGVGVAIFNHPSNFRSPTTWHARDYGLFAVNPFGLHDFEGLKKGVQDGKGNCTINRGESLTLRYRFLFAEGTPEPSDLAARFREYAAGK